MIRTLLIANRGEIAVRVIRTAHALGIDTVAVFSDADEHSLHVSLADVAVRIGPAPAAESYLDPSRILDAARRSGADAIHPGYGFLSENADFARAVVDAGLTWVGPSPEAIEVMGDKAAAKDRMRAAGVPVVPGCEFTTLPSTEQCAEAAESVGFPLLVKAAFGGGGRGMRRVDSPEQLATAMSSAHAEAEAAFGRGDVLLERLVERARHVEVQIFGDTHGAAIHLGERECSVQRRHQKVIEEAPCVAVTPDLRERMGAAAVAAAKAVSYAGAGTVEFLLDADGSFYFLEMNTRLQVEHPVTEQVTGLDLVMLQLRVAEGLPLGVSQADVHLTGHAVEVRLYAEDARRGYLPQTGAMCLLDLPDGEGIRIDHGLTDRSEVSAFYDPMIAKIIATGDDRPMAIRRLRRALTELTVLGVTHNGTFLRDVLDHPDYLGGAVHTGWLEEQDFSGVSGVSAVDVAVAGRLLLGEVGAGWRSSGPARKAVSVRLSDDVFSVGIAWGVEAVVVTVSDGRDSQDSFTMAGFEVVGDRVQAEVDGVRQSWRYARSGEALHLQARGRDPGVFTRPSAAATAEDETSDGTVRAPMSGKVITVSVAVGDVVSRGKVLLTLEAMKLQSPVESPVSGTVSAVRVSPDEQVQSGMVLVTVEPDPAG